MKWQLKKTNDVFFYDDGCEGYREFYVVTDGEMMFQSDEDSEMRWLRDFLNNHDKEQPNANP